VRDYPPPVTAILGDGTRLADLGPGSPDLSKKPLLTAFDPLRDLGPVTDRSMAKLCHAGLWLYHDFLDESHTISQEVETPTGSFWHAVMHRREPDPGNSKYWWRRVSKHTILEQLEYGDPLVFVDRCEKARGTGTAEEKECQRLQLAEWHALFEYCFRIATSTG
jgi:hypothetical protein